MNTALLKLVASFAAGAAAMYYLDPATGRRRRALARDRGVAVRHDLEDYARIKSRRAANRMRGALARTRAKVSTEPVDDDQLHSQIQAKLGHLVSRPGMVEVKVHEGHVVIAGNALRGEINTLLDTVSEMRGVQSVDNQLSPMPRGDQESLDARSVRHQSAHH
jgi:hyperosmotically inducible protein